MSKVVYRDPREKKKEKIFGDIYHCGATYRSLKAKEDYKSTDYHTISPKFSEIHSDEFNITLFDKYAYTGTLEDKLIKSTMDEKQKIIDDIFRDLYVIIDIMAIETNLIEIIFDKRKRPNIVLRRVLEIEGRYGSAKISRIFKSVYQKDRTFIKLDNKVKGCFIVSIKRNERVQCEWIEEIMGSYCDTDKMRNMINELIGPLSISMIMRTFEEGGPTRTWFIIEPTGVSYEREKELKRKRKFIGHMSPDPLQSP